MPRRSNKLAIVLLGERNAGKTTTLKTFFRSHLDQPWRKRVLNGWQTLETRERELRVYIVGQSPREAQTPIVEILADDEPAILICANQYAPDSRGGQQTYDAFPTFNFLKAKGYDIRVIWLNPGNNREGSWYSRRTLRGQHDRYFDYAGIASYCLASGWEVTLSDGKDKEGNAALILEKIAGWLQIR
jgi:GTPase SAR1 family protein